MNVRAQKLIRLTDDNLDKIKTNQYEKNILLLDL